MGASCLACRGHESAEIDTGGSEAWSAGGDHRLTPDTLRLREARIPPACALSIDAHVPNARRARPVLISASELIRRLDVNSDVSVEAVVKSRKYVHGAVIPHAPDVGEGERLARIRTS